MKHPRFIHTAVFLAVPRGVTKNERWVVAVYMPVHSDCRGIDLAWFFKVSKTTASGGLAWFPMLSAGLQTVILQLMDTQVPITTARNVAAAARPSTRSAPSHPSTTAQVS